MNTRKEIPYRMPDGTTNWLQPGSRAHALHCEGKAKELDAHMKDVQLRHDALTISRTTTKEKRP